MVRKPAARKVAAKKVTAPAAVVTITPAELKSFGHGDALHPGFSFTRYWWSGPGPREGIEGYVHKKARPGDDPEFGLAAKGEVLLSSAAPGVYANLNFLLENFDKSLPQYVRNVMVQVKIVLPQGEAWHVGYERVRGYARAHFARRFPVILIAHIPAVASLDGYGNHVHCIVLSRPLDTNGFGGACPRLCSDIGYEDALDAWQAWLAVEEVAA